jgi:hypothetical protein
MYIATMPFSSVTCLFLLIYVLLVLPERVLSFAPSDDGRCSVRPIRDATTTILHDFGESKQGNNNIVNSKTLTSLPKGISPFEKSKGENVQKELRGLALSALLRGINDQPAHVLLEVEFPPFLGGEDAKSQFDDFDNVQELNKNRDWCIELLPLLKGSLQSTQTNIWLVLPDLKEVELAKQEWTGKLYRDAASFTSIEAITQHYCSSNSRRSSSNNNNNNSSSNKNSQEGPEYSKPWGATLARFANQLIKGDSENSSNASGLLGDERSLDPLQDNCCDLHLICQPGNGGPVEDWINVKAFHDAAGGNIPTCIVNGALDKVRDGYYAPIIFPKLAKTFDFYKSFEAMLFLKPISDKGIYGWVFRVYPEPWQVILQTPVRDKNDQLVIQETVALVSDTRPSYQKSVQALLQTSATIAQR